MERRDAVSARWAGLGFGVLRSAMAANLRRGWTLHAHVVGDLRETVRVEKDIQPAPLRARADWPLGGGRHPVRPGRGRTGDQRSDDVRVRLYLT